MNKESIRVITCAAFNRSLNAEQLSEGVVDFINPPPPPHRPNTEKKHILMLVQLGLISVFVILFLCRFIDFLRAVCAFKNGTIHVK